MDLKIILFNVGQGDHILFELPNGKYGIIDFHYDEPYLYQNEPPVMTYLKSKQTKIEFEFICITHPDYDHIKGFEKFLEWTSEEKIKINNLWIFAGSDFKLLYKNLFSDDNIKNLKKASKHLVSKLIVDYNNIKKLINICTPSNIDYIQDIRQISPKYFENEFNLSIYSFGPLSHFIQDYNNKNFKKLFDSILNGSEFKNTQNNLLSSILLFKFGKHNLIFGGDAGIRVWKDSISKYKKLGKIYGSIKSNLIKVSHHGSKYSSDDKIWSAILGKKESHILISSGIARGNFKHPDIETLKDIIEVSKKNNMEVNFYKTARRNICLAKLGLNSENNFLDIPLSVDEMLENSLNEINSEIEDGYFNNLFYYSFELNSKMKKIRTSVMLNPNIKVNSKNCLFNQKYLCQIENDKKCFSA